MSSMLYKQNKWVARSASTGQKCTGSGCRKHWYGSVSRQECIMPAAVVHRENAFLLGSQCVAIKRSLVLPEGIS